MQLKHITFSLLLFILSSKLTFSQNNNGHISIDCSPEINTLIAKKINYNKENHTIDGYRIQLFYGSENGVNSARNKFRALFPNTATYVDYESPEWKVRVGNYKTRLEADRALQEIILNFGDAIVIEYKIKSQ